MASVNKAVVHSISSSLPEFDFLVFKPVTTPVIRHWFLVGFIFPFIFFVIVLDNRIVKDYIAFIFFIWLCSNK